ncbi:hypothetical protein SEA_PUPPERS_28 [Gordonia phage Puppers]|nr:hypothetical protein SEA_PUPPERS_28 [Gordonia phage Puppers]
MRHILSGDVATRVPSSREAPTELPEPVVASSFVPALVVAPADLPRLTSVATKLPPAEVIVPTTLPFWLRRLTAVLNAQAEIRVQVVAVELHGAEAIHGRAEIRPEVVAVELPAGSRSIAGRGLISALVTMNLPAGVRELAGRAQILVSAAMTLPAGVRELGARAAIAAAVQTVTMEAGGVTLAGRGAITASGVSQALAGGDSFTRSDSSAGLGTGWSQYGSTGAVGTGIVSNAARSYIQTTDGTYYSRNRFDTFRAGGDDMFVEARVSAVNSVASGRISAMFLRMTNTGDPGDIVGLYLENNTAYIGSAVGGTFTARTGSLSTVAASDLFQLRASGRVFTAYRNGSAIGSWTDTGAVTALDSSHRAGGLATTSVRSFFTNYYSYSLDDFRTGDLSLV